MKIATKFEILVGMTTFDHALQDFTKDGLVVRHDQISDSHSILFNDETMALYNKNSGAITFHRTQLKDVLSSLFGVMTDADKDAAYRVIKERSPDKMTAELFHTLAITIGLEDAVKHYKEIKEIEKIIDYSDNLKAFIFNDQSAYVKMYDEHIIGDSSDKEAFTRTILEASRSLLGSNNPLNRLMGLIDGSDMATAFSIVKEESDEELAVSIFELHDLLNHKFERNPNKANKKVSVYAFTDNTMYCSFADGGKVIHREQLTSFLEILSKSDYSLDAFVDDIKAL